QGWSLSRGDCTSPPGPTESLNAASGLRGDVGGQFDALAPRHEGEQLVHDRLAAGERPRLWLATSTRVAEVEMPQILHEETLLQRIESGESRDISSLAHTAYD